MGGRKKRRSTAKPASGARSRADLRVHDPRSSNALALEELAREDSGDGDFDRTAARTRRSPKYEMPTGTLGRLRCLVLGLSVEDEEFDATCASPREVDDLSPVQSLSCEAELPARLADIDERDHVERISVAPGSDTAGKRDPRSVLAVERETGAHRRGSRSSERAARHDDNERDNECAHVPIIGRTREPLHEPLSGRSLKAPARRVRNAP